MHRRRPYFTLRAGPGSWKLNAYVEIPASELDVNIQPQIAKINKFFTKSAKFSYKNSGTWSKSNGPI